MLEQMLEDGKQWVWNLSSGFKLSSNFHDVPLRFLEPGVLHEAHEKQSSVTEGNCSTKYYIAASVQMITQWLLWVQSSGFQLSKEFMPRPLQEISLRQIIRSEHPERGREPGENHEVYFMSYKENQILWWTELFSVQFRVLSLVETWKWILMAKYFNSLYMTCAPPQVLWEVFGPLGCQPHPQTGLLMNV